MFQPNETGGSKSSAVCVAEMDSLQKLQIGREKAMRFPDEGAGEWSHPLLS